MANPFQRQKETIAAESADVRAAGTRAEQVLNATQNTSRNVLQEKAARTKEYLATINAVNQKVQGDVKQLQTQVAPFVKQQQEVIGNIQKATSMNPILRDLFGIFDSRYNLDYQQRRLQAANLGISAAQDAFSRLKMQNEAMVQAAQTGYQAATLGLDVEQAMANLNAEAAMKDWQIQREQLDSVMGELNANSALILAEQRQKSETMSQLAPDEINSLLAQAQRAPNGRVAVGNVELSKAELMDLSDSWDKKNMALESADISLQAGRADLAKSHYVNLINSMNRTELTQFISDGTYQDKPLDPQGQFGLKQVAIDALQNLETLTSKTSSFNESQLYQGAFAAMYDTQAANMDLVLGNGKYPGRANLLFGGKPPVELQQLGNEWTALAGTWMSTVKQAQESGIGLDKDSSKLMTDQMNSFIKKYNDTLDKVAETYAGDSAALKNVAKAYLQGASLSSSAAVDGLIDLVSTGIPANLELQGPTSEAFKAANEEVNRFWESMTDGDVNFMAMSPAQRSQAIAGAMAGLMKRTGKTKDQIEHELHQRVAGAVRKKFNNGIWNQMQYMLPSIASRITMPDGTKHPFSKLPPDEWASIINEADTAGIESIARRLDMKPEALLNYVNGYSKKEPKWNEDIPNRVTLDAQLLSAQLSSIAVGLGSSSIATREFDPGQALADLFSRPEFAQQVKNDAFGLANASLVGFTAYNATGGGIMDSVKTYGENYKRQLIRTRSDQTKQIVERGRLYGRDPQTRAEVITSAIARLPNSGLNDQDVATFMQALPQAFASTQNMNSSDVRRGIQGIGAFGQAVGSATWTYVDSAIKSMKFDDPNLERIRKIIAKHWDTVAPTIDAAQARLIQGK